MFEDKLADNTKCESDIEKGDNLKDFIQDKMLHTEYLINWFII